MIEKVLFLEFIDIRKLQSIQHGCLFFQCLRSVPREPEKPASRKLQSGPFRHPSNRPGAQTSLLEKVFCDWRGVAAILLECFRHFAASDSLSAALREDPDYEKIGKRCAEKGNVLSSSAIRSNGGSLEFYDLMCVTKMSQWLGVKN